MTSIASFVENTNISTAYQEFCKNLHQIGVTEDLIREKEKEILEILRPQSMAAGSQIGGSNTGDKGQLQLAGYVGPLQKRFLQISSH